MGSVYRRALRALIGTLAVAVVAVVPLAATPPAAAAGSTGLVISQVYGGGGMSGASYNADFVELFNRGTVTQSLLGWSLQFAPGGGAGWSVMPLSGTLEPGKHLLVRLGTSGSSGASLPAADMVNTGVNLGTSGKVAIRANTSAYTSCAEGWSIDLVSYGYADCAEFTPGPLLSATTAGVRRGGGCTDTDNNFNDIAQASPYPRNSSAAAHPCSGGTTPPPPTGSANLTISAVGSPPSTIVRGQSFTASDTVRNAGTAIAGSSSTAYYLSGDWAPGGDLALSGTRSVVSIAAGGSSSGTRSVIVPTTTPAGTYRVVACADASRVVVESNEGDNCRVSSGSITVQTGATSAGGADLVVSSLSTPPSSRARGTSFTMTERTTNQGGATAASSRTWFRLSIDKTYGSGDPLLAGSRSVPSLAPSQWSDATTTVAVMSSTSPGTYWVLACADGGGAVAESSEANNCRPSATQIRIT